MKRKRRPEEAEIRRRYRELLGRPRLSDQLRADGRVVVKLKTAWRDGTTHLLFEPVEFLEKLAALTPRPEVNLLIYHGVLAPHAQWRRHVVAYGRTASENSDAHGAGAVLVCEKARPACQPRYWAWAALMRRAFEIDVLACPRCGGRLRLIATVEDPGVIRKILAHLGLSRSAESPGPAPPQPAAVASARVAAGSPAQPSG